MFWKLLTFSGRSPFLVGHPHCCYHCLVLCSFLQGYCGSFLISAASSPWGGYSFSASSLVIPTNHKIVLWLLVKCQIVVSLGQVFRISAYSTCNLCASHTGSLPVPLRWPLCLLHPVYLLLSFLFTEASCKAHFQYLLFHGTFLAFPHPDVIVSNSNASYRPLSHHILRSVTALRVLMFFTPGYRSCLSPLWDPPNIP